MLLYEIHRDGVPRLLRNQKLFEESIRSVVHRFCVGASGAQFAVVFDEDRKSRPGILHVDCMKCLGLTEMTCKRMVVQVFQNMESKIAMIGNIFSIGIAE